MIIFIIFYGLSNVDDLYLTPAMTPLIISFICFDPLINSILHQPLIELKTLLIVLQHRNILRLNAMLVRLTVDLTDAIHGELGRRRLISVVLLVHGPLRAVQVVHVVV